MYGKQWRGGGGGPARCGLVSGFDLYTRGEERFEGGSCRGEGGGGGGGAADLQDVGSCQTVGHIHGAVLRDMWWE